MSTNINPHGSLQRGINSLLSGLSTATNAVISTTDSVLTALGKLQAQITANKTAIDANTTLIAPVVRKIGAKWYESGKYFDAAYPAGLATTSVPPSAGDLYYFPFLALENTDFDQIGINVTTGVASSTITLAIFDSDANNQPLNRLTMTSALDSSTTGVKSETISQTMVAGQVYWLAYLALGGAPTVTGAPTATFRSITGATSLSVASSNVYFFSAQSAIPSVASIANPTALTGTLPLIRLRAA